MIHTKEGSRRELLAIVSTLPTYPLKVRKKKYRDTDANGIPLEKSRLDSNLIVLRYRVASRRSRQVPIQAAPSAPATETTDSPTSPAREGNSMDGSISVSP